MKSWDTLPPKSTIEAAMNALQANGITSFFASTRDEAKEKVLSLIPQNSEVMTMTSVTLSETGILDEIQKSGKYIDLKKKLFSLNRETDDQKMREIGSSPQWALGSVHAVTENGDVLIASNTGSQLPAYAYGAGHVIWVVGAQKIVKNIDEGMRRIHEHTLPLESKRAHEAYGVEKSNVSKILLISKEVNPERLKLLFVNEVIGY